MTAILADIGGTNTRVALADGKVVRTESISKYANAEFDGLEPILRRYMAERGLSAVEGACVAAAGPVVDGVAEMTNLSWVIDGALLTRATGATKVAILNDLQAQGQALGHIAPDHLAEVVSGQAKPGASMLVVGLGTGVNAAPVHETPWGRVVPPSECGHVSLPVRTAEDMALAEFISGYGPHAHGFAGVEDALAGRGFEHIHAFVTARAGGQPGKSSAEIMADLKSGEALAREAARLYVHVLGHVLGNLALTHLPYGGMFLIGGMARALTPWMGEFGLKAALCDKGRFADFLKSFPVWVVEDDFAALTGCAAYLEAGGIG
jgi:glucokinase